MKKIILGSLFVASSLFAGDVLAVVNGSKITKQQVDAVLAQRNITYDSLPEAFKKKILDNIITDALLIQKAENTGIEKTKEYKTNLLILKKQLAKDLFLKNKAESFKITDSEIRKFYNKYKDIYFKKEEQVKARHILVKTKDQAEKIIAQLEKTPFSKRETKFIELAKKYSVGPTKNNGGELGWFTRKKMIPEFSKVAFEMKKGEFSSKPVKTQYGWHVIYIQDKKTGGYIPFNEVKDKIKKQLQILKVKEYIRNIKAQANIKYK